MMRMRAMFIATPILGAPRQIQAAPADCSSPANVVHASICASPTPSARDTEIAQRYAHLQAACAPEQGKIFAATQRLWLRERGNCQPSPGQPGHHASVAACLADVMEARLT